MQAKSDSLCELRQMGHRKYATVSRLWIATEISVRIGNFGFALEFLEFDMANKISRPDIEKRYNFHGRTITYRMNLSAMRPGRVMKQIFYIFYFSLFIHQNTTQ